MKLWTWFVKRLEVIDVLGYLKIATALGAAVVIGWLYTSNLRKAHDITELKSEVAALVVNKQILESRVESYKKLASATATASKEVQEGLKQQDKLEKETKATLDQIEVVQKPATGVDHAEASQKTVDYGALSDDLSRLLNNHCASVLGKTCANP